MRIFNILILLFVFLTYSCNMITENPVEPMGLEMARRYTERDLQSKIVYVSKAGNDTNQGSLSKPVKS